MLRRLLQDITRGGGKVSGHPELIAAINSNSPHSIRSLSNSSSNLRYNCVMYALGIENDPEYLSLVPKFVEGVHADPEFIEFLVEGGSMRERKSAARNLLAVYSKEDRVEHVGRCISKTRVISKWGTGHLYDHALWEVPENYGSTLRFYTPPVGQIVEHFVQYAASKGTHFVAVQS